jgi:hypothetical protein
MVFCPRRCSSRCANSQPQSPSHAGLSRCQYGETHQLMRRSLFVTVPIFLEWRAATVAAVSQVAAIYEASCTMTVQRAQGAAYRNAVRHGLGRDGCNVSYSASFCPAAARNISTAVFPGLLGIVNTHNAATSACAVVSVPCVAVCADRYASPRPPHDPPWHWAVVSGSCALNLCGRQMQVISAAFWRCHCSLWFRVWQYLGSATLHWMWRTVWLTRNGSSSAAGFRPPGRAWSRTVV